MLHYSGSGPANGAFGAPIEISHPIRRRLRTSHRQNGRPDSKGLRMNTTHSAPPGGPDPSNSTSARAGSQLAGGHKTLAGDTVTVQGSGKHFSVEGATVLCGNIPTARATVYVVDAVLMP